MSKRRVDRQLHGVLGALMLLCSAAATGEAAAMSRADDDADTWHFAITPYLWATRMNGDVQAGPLPNASLDMKFSDILETLDFGFMTAAEARKGRWGILIDGMFMNVSDSARMSREDIALTVDGDLEIKQLMLAGAVAYRVADGRNAVDVIGGVRYSAIDADGAVDARLTGAGSGVVSLSGSTDWVDPYIGVRVTVPLNGQWSMLGYADFGGFGAGSDFTWQGMIGMNYAFSGSLSVLFGYRYMKVDYDRDDFLYDVANDGLYTGVTMHF